MWAHRQHSELGEGASDGQDPAGHSTGRAPECCPQAQREMGLGKARGETAAPVEIGAGGSPKLPATQAAATLSQPGIHQQGRSEPPLSFAELGPAAKSCRGQGDPQTSFHEVSLRFPFSWSGFLGCWGPQLPRARSNPPFCRPPPAFPFPLCLPGTCWSVAGTELLALGRLHRRSPGCSCRGRADGRQGRSHPAKLPRESHHQKLLFCCLELLVQVQCFQGIDGALGAGAALV